MEQLIQQTYIQRKRRRRLRKIVDDDGKIEVVLEFPQETPYSLEKGEEEKIEKAEEAEKKEEGELKQIRIYVSKFDFLKFSEIKNKFISKRYIFSYPKYINFIHLIERWPFERFREIDTKKISSGIYESAGSKILDAIMKKFPKLYFEDMEEIKERPTNIEIAHLEDKSKKYLNSVFLTDALFLEYGTIKTNRISVQPKVLVEGKSEEVYSYDVGEGFFDPVEKILGKGLKVMSERPILILAVKPQNKNQEYLEFLKRICKEMYRVVVRGLASPAHISEGNIEEIKYDIQAGKHIYVIDLDNINNLRNYITDRIKELFSQNYGFIILYGDQQKINEIEELWEGQMKLIEDSKEYILFDSLPPYIKINIENLSAEAIRKIIGLMWGFASLENVPEDLPIDNYVVGFENYFYRKIEDYAADPKLSMIVEPNTKDEEESLEGGKESIVHYGIKAFIVKYLYEKEKIPLSKIYTEKELSGIGIVDVYLYHPKYGDLAIEVETLYGTTLPLLKLRKRIESRISGGLTLWVVVPNPQFMIYFKEISFLRKFYKKKYGNKIEFFTLDIRKGRIVPYPQINEILNTL